MSSERPRIFPSLPVHVVSLALVLSTPGCTAPEVDLTEIEAQNRLAVTVDPTGGAAELLVTVPADAAITPSVTARRSTVAIDLNMTVGTGLAVTPGTYCMNFSLPLKNGADASRHVTSACDLTATPGARTTLALGGVDVKRSSATRVIGIDVPLFTGSYPYAPMERLFALSSGILPEPAGTLSLGPWADIVVTTQGAVVPYVVDDRAGRYALELRPTPPTTRALPDVPAGFGIALGVGAKSPDSSTGVLQVSPTALTSTFTRLDEGALYLTRAAAKDSLVLGAFAYPSPFSSAMGSYLPTAAPDKPIHVITFARLDVNDVTVTMLDGSTKTVQGTFTVKPKNGMLYPPTLVAGAPTGHGIDLPPGVYLVIVEYTSPVDGTPTSYTDVVTLP